MKSDDGELTDLGGANFHGAEAALRRAALVARRRAEAVAAKTRKPLAFGTMAVAHGSDGDPGSEATEASAIDVEVSEHVLRVALSDGRVISVPVEWYPRLVHATQEEKRNWRLIGGGLGIRWKDIDEDISVQSLLMGKASMESLSSFSNWLETRSE